MGKQVKQDKRGNLQPSSNWLKNIREMGLPARVLTLVLSSVIVSILATAGISIAIASQMTNRLTLSTADIALVKNELNLLVFSILGFIVFAVIVVMLIARYIVNKSIRRPLNQLIGITDAIASGQINFKLKEALREIHSNDEIRTLSISMNSEINAIFDIATKVKELKEAASNKDLTVTIDDMKFQGMYHDIMLTVEEIFRQLQIVVSEIGVVAEEISVGAHHSSSASQNLAEGTSEQVSITQNLSSTVQKVSEIAQNNVRGTEQADVAMTTTKSSIDESNRYMIEVTKAMDDINHKSNEITKIVRTIDDIAFQTNILALNAAIEAARAGQAGKGFSVVAEEVRNLANKSSQAAASVSELILASSTAIENCTVITKQTEESLSKAVAESNNVMKVVETIKNSSQDQYHAIVDITEGITNITNITQNNAAIAEETAASSEQLANQSVTLKDLVGQYKFRPITK